MNKIILSLFILLPTFSNANVFIKLNNCQYSCSKACASLLYHLDKAVNNVKESCGDIQKVNCVPELAKIRKFWSGDSSKEACTNTNPICVIDVAKKQEFWMAKSLKEACIDDVDNCTGQLTGVQKFWSAKMLKQACQGANTDCVIELAKTKQFMMPNTLNKACARINS